MRWPVLRAAVLAMMALLWPSASATADEVIPVRGGEIRLPAFDPDDWADSDSCQLALNAAIHDLQAQMAAMPLPPPGEPGYHEWAEELSRQIMEYETTYRRPCLMKGTGDAEVAPPPGAAPPGGVVRPEADQPTDAGVSVPFATDELPDALVPLIAGAVMLLLGGAWLIRSRLNLTPAEHHLRPGDGSMTDATQDVVNRAKTMTGRDYTDVMDNPTAENLDRHAERQRFGQGTAQASESIVNVASPSTTDAGKGIGWLWHRLFGGRK
jgi:hypothetical protein